MTAVKPQPGPTGSPAAAEAPPRRAAGDGIRDTLDSIIVAFILAFVFRAFIVEAFVIPTGSMASTLYGAHHKHRCSNCGYTFAFGMYEDRVQHSFAVTCPNCGNTRDYFDGSRLPVLADGGDRILVHKWPFDLGGKLLAPHRWSVVVFKDPRDGKQNFIKRLVGMPDEVLEIIDGDIYAAPASQVSEALRVKLLRDPLEGRGRELGDADFRELDRHLKVQRKTRSAQSALWMVHYDHDYPPRDRVPNYPHWDAGGSTEATGWDADSPVVTFDGRTGKAHPLLLAGKPITDYCGYNTEFRSVNSFSQLRNVGDVRVRFVLTPRGPSGEFELSLSKYDDEFRVAIRADGRVSLLHRKLSGSRPPRELSARQADALVVDRPIAVEFSNVDSRVELRIDDHEVIATTDDQYHPDTGSLRKLGDNARVPSGVSVAATGLPLTIRHLVVERDVYYRSVETEQDVRRENPYAERRIRAWGTSGNPIYLRNTEYFMCGDNSPASKDSRLWWEPGDFVQRRGRDYQRGTVPADQLIGEAFFVYWPSGHRLGERGLPVIPNVGRMRIIR